MKIRYTHYEAQHFGLQITYLSSRLNRHFIQIGSQFHLVNIDRSAQRRIKRHFESCIDLQAGSIELRINRKVLFLDWLYEGAETATELRLEDNAFLAIEDVFNAELHLFLDHLNRVGPRDLFKSVEITKKKLIALSEQERLLQPL